MLPKLIIIGDSHVNIYASSSEIRNKFNVMRIIHSDCEDVARNGKFLPYLMNTIGDKGESLIKHHIDKYNDTEYTMFIFGEPDIRIHIHKQVKILNRDEDEVIQTLALKFISKIIEITPKHLKIIIRYILPQREHSMFGEWVPNGTLSDRNRYTNKLNATLNQICVKKRILFFDNYERDSLVKEDGSLKDEYCDGTTHYNLKSIPFIDKEISKFFTLSNI